MKYILAVLTIFLSSFMALQAPQIESSYLRYRVGSNVVKVIKVDILGRTLGGGTGFAIQAPSGEEYIMTNAHVCDMYHGGMATIEEQDGTVLDRRIIKISGNTDLCLIEADYNLMPIKLAKSVDIGDRIAVVGHPQLMPLNVSYGDILGQSPMDVMIGVIGENMTKEQCSNPKNKIYNYDAGFGIFEICLEEINAYQTTAVSMPGNSGSPVVNVYGHLIGVLFAGDDKVYWGGVVALEDVKNFLSDF